VFDSLVWHDKLRYRLLPYTYTVAADTFHRDGTIMRGLAMDFTDDVNARDVRDEYLFGKAFLVAPVHQYKARTRQVYLPAGADWYDFHTGTKAAGGQSVEATAPLARMPLYVRRAPSCRWVRTSSTRPTSPVRRSRCSCSREPMAPSNTTRMTASATATSAANSRVFRCATTPRRAR
jgi:alpha-glucosidase (family GH31 glycosyl hydrolase)